MYERIVVMLESALFHQNDASSMLQDAYTPVRRDYQTEIANDEGCNSEDINKEQEHQHYTSGGGSHRGGIGSYLATE